MYDILLFYKEDINIMKEIEIVVFKTKKEAQKQLDNMVVECSKKWCAPFTSTCKTFNCHSFCNGKIIKDEDGYLIHYKPYCNCPLVTGIMHHIE